MDEKWLKLMDERDEHQRFAMEANDILRDIWNRGLLEGTDAALVKRRVAALLGVYISKKTV